MAKEYQLKSGEPPLRLICPRCESTWETMECPSMCLTCGALVTVRMISPAAPRI